MRRGRSSEGSALVITVMMLLVMIAFTSVLLSAPMNQLSKVGESSTKERAVTVADAGLRDAIQYLAANPSEAELAQTSPFTTTGMSSTTPSGGLSTFTQHSYYPATATGFTTKYWDGKTYHDTNVTGSTAYYFVQKSFANGRYAWRVIRRDTGYYQVIALGLVTGGSGTQSPYTKIEAVLKKTGSTGTLPAAATFMNPTGQSISGGPQTIYDTQNGGSPPSINGTDAAGGGTNIPGVAIQDSNYGFGSGAGSIVGTPSSIVGGSSGNAGPTAAQWAQLQALVETISTASGGNVHSLTYPSVFVSPGGSEQIYYVKVPANTTISSSLLTINGNHPMSGVMVMDLGDNVTVNSDLYQKNGTSYFQGAMIIMQRGRIRVSGSGLHFLHKNGNNANFLQYDSVAVANALAPLSASTKIASYIVQ